MSLEEKIRFIAELAELNSAEIEENWKQALQGDVTSYNSLKFNYMKQLNRIKPLYKNIDEQSFYNLLEQSVIKALERGLKFQVSNFDSYMVMASNTYFKHLVVTNSETLQIPSQLIRAFSKLEEVYDKIPALNNIAENKQINLLSKGFEYPIFPTRLLYYSFIKWKNNNLRQVDIDLTVNLLPAPQRIEWEIFYEKNIEEIVKSILSEIED